MLGINNGKVLLKLPENYVYSNLILNRLNKHHHNIIIDCSHNKFITNFLFIAKPKYNH